MKRLVAVSLVIGFLLAGLVTFTGGGIHDPNQPIGYDAAGGPLHPNPNQGRIWGRCVVMRGGAYPDPDAQCKTGPSPETAAAAQAEADAGAPGVVVLPNCADGGMGVILATIRKRESKGNYRALAPVENPDDAASGAYQFIRGTWGNYGGYRRAMDAPPHIQDEKARINVEHALRVGGIEGVPAIWYVGHVPTSEREWNTVPFPEAGNTLTVRQYANNWMVTYREHAAACA